MRTKTAVAMTVALTVALLGGVSQGVPFEDLNLNVWRVDGTSVVSTAPELNTLAGGTGTLTAAAVSLSGANDALAYDVTVTSLNVTNNQAVTLTSGSYLINAITNGGPTGYAATNTITVSAPATAAVPGPVSRRPTPARPRSGQRPAPAANARRS